MSIFLAQAMFEAVCPGSTSFPQISQCGKRRGPRSSNKRRMVVNKVDKQTFLAALFAAAMGLGWPVHALAVQGTLMDDSYTVSSGGQANNVQGAKATILVSPTANGFFQFDLSTLPSGTTSADITKATLTLFASKVTTPGTFDVKLVTGAWNESTITGHNSAGLIGAPSITGVTIDAADFLQYVTIDLTDIVKFWVDGGANHGISLVANGPLSVQFDAKESTATAHPAQLEIVSLTTGSSTGPTGPTGPIGPAGPQGSAGAAGAQGPQGLKGDKGDKGDSGSPGDPGPVGAAGAQGLQGPKGDSGPQGATGPAGLHERSPWHDTTTDYVENDVVTFDGSTWRCAVALCTTGLAPSLLNPEWEQLAARGDTGPMGPAGDTGPAGPQGPGGAAGAIGAQGPQGATGAQGETGATGAQGPVGPTGAKGDKGDKGDTGATGAQGPAGATGPAGANGSSIVFKDAWPTNAPYLSNQVVTYDGQTFIALNDNDGSVAPDVSADWLLMAAKGADGAVGAQGPQGPAGTNGTNGTNGADGAAGAQGPQGPAGPAGPTGAAGAAGTTGPAGPTGSTGATGAAACVAGTVALNGGTNSANLSTSASNYASLIAATTPSATTTNGNAPVLCGGTLSNFAVTLSGTPNNGGGTQQYTFTVMVNGAASSLSCPISEFATTCSDAGSITLNPGDVVNVQSTPSGTPTARSATWSSSYARGSGSTL
jgi:hypothetical protein